jgi:hypothetical protein
MKKTPWTRNDRIGAAALAVALIACASAFVIPEVRQFVGLEKPAAIQAPAQVPTSATPSTVAPSEATPSVPTSQALPAQTHKSPSQTHAAARTSGDISPAVGSITQGAGSALSINQEGGITAGTVNIGALPPKPLVLTDAQASLVRSDLEKYSGSNIEVALVNPTKGTTEFGNRLVSTLKDAGWNVNYSSFAILIRSNGAQPPPGLSLDIGENSKSVASELASSLIRHAVIDDKPIPALQAREPGKLTLYICEPK